MGRQQQIIKDFMQRLCKTTTGTGQQRMDAAIRAASNGRFSGNLQLVNDFLNECRRNKAYTNTNDANAKAFLKEIADVNLDNEDNGAATGYDAGGSKTQLNESAIVAEDYSKNGYNNFATNTGSDYNYTGGNRYIEIADEAGGNPVWVKVLSNEASRKMQNYIGEGYGISDNLAKQLVMETESGGDSGYNLLDVVRGQLTHRWIPAALKLITQSYGLDFPKSKSGEPTKIVFSFYYNSNTSTVAATKRLEKYDRNGDVYLVRINMYPFQNIKYNPDSFGDGYSKNYVTQHTYYQNYLDTTLAHELVHAIMQANMGDSFNVLKHYMHEGLAELVIGADGRDNDILKEIKNPESLRAAWNNNTYDSTSYAAGYVLYRYMMKQSAAMDNFWKTATLSDNQSTVTLSSAFKGTMGTENLSNAITKIDARKTSGVTVDLSRAMRAAVSFYGSRGQDTLRIYQNNDSVNVYGYESQKDVIQFMTGSVKNAQRSGADFVLNYGNNQKITFKNVGTNIIKTREANGMNLYATGRETHLSGLKETQTMHGGEGIDHFWMHAGDGADTVYGYESQKDVVHIKTGSLRNITRSGSDAIVNYGNGDKLTLKGAAGSIIKVAVNNETRLYSSPYGNHLSGSKENLKMYGNTGVDHFWMHAGDGVDTVYGYESQKDVVHIKTGSLRNITRSGSDAIVNYGNGDKLTLKGAAGSIIKVAVNNETRLYSSPYGNHLSGSKENLSMYGNTGVDHFWMHAGDGTDTVYGYESQKDVVHIKTGSLKSVTKSGNDAVVSYGNGDRLTLKGAAGSIIKVAVNNETRLYASPYGSHFSGSKEKVSMYGSTGVDHFWMHAGDATTTIYGYESQKDVIHIKTGNYKNVTRSGNDAVLTYGNVGGPTTSVIVKNVAGKTLRVADKAGRISTHSIPSATTHAKMSLSYLYDNQIVSKSSSVASLTPTSSSRGLASQAYASPVTSARKKTL